MILDSGQRQQFSSGAVRDTQTGKGRCDLLPLAEVAEFLGEDIPILQFIGGFIREGKPEYLYNAMRLFCASENVNLYTATLEVAIHYEEGSLKYSERNWEAGIPLSRFMSSGIRHYLKHKRGDTDERHDRAFLWNMLGALYTLEHMPEMNDLPCGTNYGK